MYAVANNFTTDKVLFDIFVRNCVEVGILNKLNLIVTNAELKGITFKDD